MRIGTVPRHKRHRGDRGHSLVVSAACLEHRLVGPSAAGNDANHRAALRADRLLRARREADLGRALVLVVRDDHGVVAGATRKGTAVADLGLDRGAHGSLGHGHQGKDVAHSEGGCCEGKLGTMVDGRGGCINLGQNGKHYSHRLLHRVLSLGRRSKMRFGYVDKHLVDIAVFTELDWMFLDHRQKAQ